MFHSPSIGPESFPRSAALPAGGSTVLAFHVGQAAVHLGVFARGRLTHRCRLGLDDALRPGVIAQRFLGKHPTRFASVVGCSASRSCAPRVTELLGEATGQQPLELVPDSNHGLEIGYRSRGEINPVRIAAVLGARTLRPDTNLLVLECGTCTTLTPVTRAGFVPGGVILHGLDLWPALSAEAGGIARVVGRFRRSCLGRSADEAVASGAYHGYTGALREISRQLCLEAFRAEESESIATGSHARLLRQTGIFTHFEPRLILLGLHEFARRRNELK